MSLYGRYPRRALVQNANMHTLFTEYELQSAAPLNNPYRDVVLVKLSGFIPGYSDLNP